MLIQLVLLVLSCRKVEPFRKIVDIIEVLPENPSSTLILFHGAGDTGEGFKIWLDLVKGRTKLFPNMHIIFPTAPIVIPKRDREINVGSTKGKELNAWFQDRYYVFRGKEDLPTIHRVALDIIDIMKNESQYGIKFNKIFLGGFGMGGNMAMHIAYRYTPEVRGVFALSTFLKRHSSIYRCVRMANQNKNKRITLPSLFLCMGEQDLETKPEYTVKTFKRMRRLKVDVELHTMTRTAHEIKKLELKQVHRWILKKLGGEQGSVDSKKSYDDISSYDLETSQKESNFNESISPLSSLSSI